jgi:predicted SprT family Zn-dependent metalloprotease
MTPHDKPKSRLQAHAPRCARCRALMKVRTLYPGRKVDDVTYRCDECGAEVLRSVPRPQ